MYNSFISNKIDTNIIQKITRTFESLNYMSTKLVTPIFRVSFPHVFEMSSYAESTPKYSLSAIWEPERFTAKEKELWAKINAEMNKVSIEKFKKKWCDLPSNIRRGLKDGGEKENLSGYGEGKLFATLSSKNKPGIIDIHNEIITSPDDFYAGCYAQAVISIYSYDNKGKGIAFGLSSIRKIKDGERLDSYSNPLSDFADQEIDDAWME